MMPKAKNGFLDILYSKKYVLSIFLVKIFLRFVRNVISEEKLRKLLTENGNCDIMKKK